MENSSRGIPRKKLYIIVAVVLAIVVLIAVRLAADNSSPTMTSSNAPPPVQKYTLGDTVTVGEYTFTFSDFKVTEGSDSKIVAINGSVSNETRNPITVYTSLIELTDGLNTFTDASNTIISGGLNPGLTQSGTVTFEIPKTSDNLRIVVRDNPFGGGESARIYLEDTQ
ncbi:DUF4352 domain-containing protein [Neobacillus mesonae]|nr:DUF4352 domain-containing protein [Neobacillus mesonae]